jgi:hypothetical protein
MPRLNTTLRPFFSEAFGSNLDPEIDPPDWGFCRFDLSLQIRGRTFREERG